MAKGNRTGKGWFQPGKSGNPGGRKAPEAKPFLHQLKHAIAIDSKDRLRKAAEKLLTLAAQGKPWAIQMLCERLDGKAPLDVKITRDVRDMSLDDILAELAEARTAAGASEADAGTGESDQLH